jgi:hypothetical protein
MKKSILIGMPIALLCLGLIGGLTAEEPSPQLKAKPQKWEYQVLSNPNPKDEHDQLNKLGKDGWELVSVLTWEANGNTIPGYIFYFKRPLAQ